MKKSKFIFVLFLVSTLLTKCNCLNNDGELEVLDTTSPTINVVTPNQNATFYTEDGADSPDYVIINATATDESKIVEGRVYVFNSNDEEVYYYEELSVQQRGNSINEVYTSFRTLQEGNYSINFEFEDEAGNIAVATRAITCIYSPIGGDTDAN